MNSPDKDFKTRKIKPDLSAFIFAHKWALLLSSLAVFVLAILSARGLNWQEDIMKLLPDNDPFIKEYRELVSAFRLTDMMFIDVGASEDANPCEEELLCVADSLADRLESSGLFEKIIYSMEFEEILAGIDILKRHRSVLFTEDDAVKLAGKLKLDEIQARLSKWKDLLTESPSPFLTQILYSDPVGIDDRLMEKLNAVRSRGESAEIHNGRLFTQDMRHILIVAQPRYSGTDSQRSQELINFMNRAISDAKKEVSSGEVEISYLCGHRFAVENAVRIKRDVKLTVAISVIAISLLSILVYSRPVLVLLTLLPALFGCSIALGLMRYLAPDISAISIGCGAMLIGIAVDYGIHLLYHADQLSSDMRDKRPLANLISLLTRPILLAAATSLAAFLTLQFSTFPGYRELGLFAGCGIIGAVVFVLIVLPLLVPQNRSARRRSPLVPVADIFPPFFRWSARHRKMIFITILAVSSVALCGLKELEFDGDIQRLNAVSPEIQRDWDNITSSFGDFISSTLVVVSGKDLEECLQENEKLCAELNRLKDDGIVKSFGSLSSFFPSLAMQDKNKKRWQDFWDDKTQKEVQANLNKACTELRIRSELFDDFLRTLKNGGKTTWAHGSEMTAQDKKGDSHAIGIDDYKGSFLSAVVLRRISLSSTGCLIATNVRFHNPEDCQTIINRLQEKVLGASLCSGRYLVTHMVTLIFGELKKMGCISLLLISLFLVVFTRKSKTVIIMLLPLFVSLIWTFGIMGWMHIKINIMNCIVAIFVFGLVIDYCIFLVSAYNSSPCASDRHIGITGAAITISALTTMSGMGSLLAARHPALYSLGSTALLAMASGLVAVLLIIPLCCTGSKVRNGDE
jgi:hypothetical protein